MLCLKICKLIYHRQLYKNKNPEIEEAIACIEALARVPQQAIKWGYLTTKETMHDPVNIL